MTTTLRILAALSFLAIAACAPDRARRAEAASGTARGATAAGAGAPGAEGRDERDRQLDSALARFRADLPAVRALADGEASREALVHRFVRALERADTNDLRAMTMSRAEFAHLYYPGSAYTRRPMRQEAALVWFLHLQESQKGVSRALARFGGARLRLVDHRCAAQPVREGANVLWHGCVLRVAPHGDTVALRLFGPILERDGRFKLFSYANDL